MDDLLNQNYKDFKITLVDQNSSEPGTKEYLDYITTNIKEIDVVRNEINTPLNHVWNWFYENHDDEILCFLNNDVRLTNNFVKDTVDTFVKEENVGIVAHSSNHPNFDEELSELHYVVMINNNHMQGWDYAIRRSLFKPIPDALRTYCGDDFIFQNVYDNGYKMAYILSSPIIHYEGKSKKYLKENGVLDIHKYIEMGFKHHLKPNFNISKIKPTFQKLKKK
jgi:GT2 family glycosyltransferase